MESAYFLCTNRNQKSVARDMASPEGHARIRELALQSDALVETFKVGGLGKCGRDYATLAKANPRLILARPTQPAGKNA